jgi:hypothetical protein
MNKDELLLRQQVLLARGHQLRLKLALETAALTPPLALVGGVQRGLTWLYRHPLVPLGAVAAVVLWRPGSALRCGERAWSAWQKYQRLQRLLRS